MTNYYKQCKLQRNNTYQVAYIPIEFATHGSVVKIKEDEKWVGGWIIIEVSSIKLDEKHLPDSHKDIKGHRKQTGDSSPKVKHD